MVLVIEQLADDVARLEFDVVGYRELLKVALGQLHERHREQVVLRQQIAELREELGRYVAMKVA